MSTSVAAGTIIAGFRVESLIGTGAMGAVYSAQTAADERVALKVLPPELARDERFRRRFLRESKLAAGLDHPHIVPTIASGEEDGVLYLAMARVEGSDLRELLRREGRLEPERALDLLGQVAEALDVAHGSGLVHRDVKPGNILVTGEPGSEHAYLCDFGLARHVSSVRSLTGDRGFVGTIDYVPPEQIEGGHIDGRADVYSLGSVLYECLAGARPFDRESELSVVFAHLNEPPPQITDVRPDLPDAFDDVFATALAKAPENRYATCGELVEAALAALQGRTVVRRKRRRRRWLVSAAAVFAAGSAVAGGLLATGGDADRPPVAISQASIAGARLGLKMDAYKRLFGPGWRQDVLTQANFPILIHHPRRQSVYFDGKTRKAIIITTWNRNHRTAEGVGPCSTVEELKAAYGSGVKPSPWNTIKGKVYAYLVGENLLFAVGGLPPNPGTTVTAVALYDGDGPRDDGRGVDVDGGTLPFAGFVAISETPCSQA
jgi:tRNA A-37 threonylcarbamoyl transferase component Bud32